MTERQGAIIISWGANRSGIPITKAMEVMGEAVAHYQRLIQAGRARGYRAYAATGRFGGQLIVEGVLSELAAISVETESLRLVAKAGMVVEDLRVELMVGGADDDLVAYYLEGLAAMQEAALT